MNKLEKSDKKRYEWLDLIKAICIISVVLFHIKYISSNYYCTQVFNYLKNLCSLFEVTVFYCLAGITLNNEKMKNVKSFLLNKFKKLYLKVVIIGLISVFLHNILISINFYKVGYSYSGKVMKIYSLKDYFFNCINTLLLGNREVIIGAFWFVYSLIICFILLSCLDFLINKIKTIKNKREFRLLITFLLMFISIFVSNRFNITIPRFSNSFVGLFLLDFTNYLFVSRKLEKFNMYLVVACIICFLFAPFFGKISMNSNTITSPFFLIVAVFSTLYLLIFITKKMEKIKIFNYFKYIGMNSFSIMAFHFIGFKVGGILLNIFGIETDIGLLSPLASNFIYIIYYLFFGIFVSLIISFTLKKFLKFDL